VVPLGGLRGCSGCCPALSLPLLHTSPGRDVSFREAARVSLTAETGAKRTSSFGRKRPGCFRASDAGKRTLPFEPVPTRCSRSTSVRSTSDPSGEADLRSSTTWPSVSPPYRRGWGLETSFQGRHQARPFSTLAILGSQNFGPLNLRATRIAAAVTNRSVPSDLQRATVRAAIDPAASPKNASRHRLVEDAGSSGRRP
jgi:hypothetical protein